MAPQPGSVSLCPTNGGYHWVYSPLLHSQHKEAVLVPLTASCLFPLFLDQHEEAGAIDRLPALEEGQLNHASGLHHHPADLLCAGTGEDRGRSGEGGAGGSTSAVAHLGGEGGSALGWQQQQQAASGWLGKGGELQQSAGNSNTPLCVMYAPALQQQQQPALTASVP